MTLGNCGHAAVWLRANISSALSNPASDTSVEGGCDRFGQARGQCVVRRHEARDAPFGASACASDVKRSRL